MIMVLDNVSPAQGVREAYLLALRGVLISSGPRLAPATLSKVGTALDTLRDSQGDSQCASVLGLSQLCKTAGLACRVPCAQCMQHY